MNNAVIVIPPFYLYGNYNWYIGAYVTVIVIENPIRSVLILGEAVYMSHCANALGEIMYSTIFPPIMAKYLIRMGSLSLVWLPVQQKENIEFKFAKLCLK